MNRLERLTGIVLALQAQPASAQALANRFEVSRRTILRDIDALSQLRVPVIAVSGPNGGYRLPDDFSLPPVHLSSDEATVLLLGLSSLAFPPDVPLGRAQAAAWDKLLAVTNASVRDAAMDNLRHVVVVTGEDDADHAIIATLRDAASAARWVSIDHRKGDTVTTRVILPLRLQIDDNRWYVQAIDSLRVAQRTFRVSRIVGAEPATPPDNATALVRAVANDVSDYHSPDNPEIVAVLTPAGRERALEHPDLRGHVAGLNVRFRCPSSELPFYAREFLSLGTAISILAPSQLLEYIDDLVRDLAQHHGIAGNW